MRILLNVAFSEEAYAEVVQCFGGGGVLHRSYREQSCVEFLKKVWGCAFRFWSYSDSNMADRNACAQRARKFLSLYRVRYHVMGKNYVTKLIPKIEPTSQIMHFDTPPCCQFFQGE